MQFRDVIGQQKLAAKLIGLQRDNRLSHAMLFLGREGTGGLAAALAFAQFLVCENNGVTKTNAGASLFGEAEIETIVPTDSCGKCAACLKAEQFIHPDIHYSYPVVPAKPGDKPVSTDYITEWRQFLKEQPYSNVFSWLQFIEAENKQGNITAAECLDIIRKMSLKSFESEYKILIMWMPEFLGKDGNRLLKLIEEPPPQTIFILVAQDEDQILPTIISRVQMIRIPPPSAADIEVALVARSVSPDKARKVAASCGGNLFDAFSHLAHEDHNEESQLREWLNITLTGSNAAKVKTVEEIAKLGRENQKQLLKYFLHQLEEANRLEFSDTAIASNDFAGRLLKLCNFSQRSAIAEELERYIYYIERNANAKLLFHALTIRVFHIIKRNSVILIN